MGLSALKFLQVIIILPSLLFALKEYLGGSSVLESKNLTLSGVRISYDHIIGLPGKASSLSQAVKSKQTITMKGINSLFIFVSYSIGSIRVIKWMMRNASQYAASK